MSSRLIWLLTIIFILAGIFTVLTFYSKINGPPQIKVFECARFSEKTTCLTQEIINNALLKILPDKKEELIKKFSPQSNIEE
jgi:hypothetical protein